MLTINETTTPTEIYLTLMNEFRGLSEGKRAEVLATLEVFAADYRKGFAAKRAPRVAGKSALRCTVDGCTGWAMSPRGLCPAHDSAHCAQISTRSAAPVVVVGPCPACGTPATLDSDWGLCPACARERAERQALAAAAAGNA